MRSTKELAAIIRRAMRNKKIDDKGLGKLLGISDAMVEKLVCGEIVPSRSLEKRLVEKLGLDPKTVRKVSEHRERASKSRMVKQEKGEERHSLNHRHGQTQLPARDRRNEHSETGEQGRKNPP